jgi:hypothetical protein
MCTVGYAGQVRLREELELSLRCFDDRATGCLAEPHLWAALAAAAPELTLVGKTSSSIVVSLRCGQF